MLKTQIEIRHSTCHQADEDEYNFCDFLSEFKKKKIPQGLRGKEYTNQFSLQSKELLQWRITGLNVNIMT